jgi:GTP-binding protein EngB required for normal cell division
VKGGILCQPRDHVFLILGHAGAGKSYLGNRIVGHRAFPEYDGLGSREGDFARCHSFTHATLGETTVIDTPGWGSQGTDFLDDLKALTNHILEDTTKITAILVCVDFGKSGRITTEDIDNTQFIPDGFHDRIVFVFTRLNEIKDKPEKIEKIKSTFAVQFIEHLQDIHVRENPKLFYFDEETFLQDFVKLMSKQKINWKPFKPFLLKKPTEFDYFFELCIANPCECQTNKYHLTEEQREILEILYQKSCGWWAFFKNILKNWAY